MASSSPARRSHARRQRREGAARPSAWRRRRPSSWARSARCWSSDRRRSIWLPARARPCSVRVNRRCRGTRQQRQALDPRPGLELRRRRQHGGGNDGRRPAVPCPLGTTPRPGGGPAERGASSLLPLIASPEWPPTAGSSIPAAWGITSIDSSEPPGPSRAPVQTPRTLCRRHSRWSSQSRAGSATKTTSGICSACCATSSSIPAARRRGVPSPRRSPRTIELVDRSSASSPEQAVEAREVFAAIAQLPDSFRDALVAVDVAGLSYGEAASLLGTKEATITSRLFRGRAQVARGMDSTPDDVQAGRD